MIHTTGARQSKYGIGGLTITAKQGYKGPLKGLGGSFFGGGTKILITTQTEIAQIRL